MNHFKLVLSSFFASLLISISTPTHALPDQVFWDNEWPSDLEPKSGSPLLEGTVLFAQSQVIPSKHRVNGDDQPHLTALRKTLVMLRPHSIIDESAVMKMTVRDAEGNVLHSGSIKMESPENIPKQEGWIDILDGADDIEFPSSLDNAHLVSDPKSLEGIGNDPDAVGLKDLLNDNSATPNNQVEIKTANGAWERDFYLPKASEVPADSKVQFTCNSNWGINVYYPNPQTGAFRRKALSKGQVLVVIITPTNNQWLASEDLEHNDYVFGHNFYTAILARDWVTPGMTLEFAANSGEKGILEADVGGVTELVITTLDAGFLTSPRNEFTFRDDPTTNTEYFETTMASRLVVVQYETMQFDEVVLPDGTKYTSRSNDEGGVYEGDMRQYIGKLLLSHGIDLANYGVSSSLAQSESPHKFTCALLAAHNTVGVYTNGVVVHGLSGGNGMITLLDSIGNEMSHEVGHNYGLGHYVGGFDGSVHRPADEINSSWGWDSRKNIFLPNFSASNTGDEQCHDGKCESAFMGRYQYGTDAMAGGEPLWGSNRFTMYTPHVSNIIQEFLETRAMWDPTSSTGFRKYNSGSGEMEEFTNDNEGHKVPRLYRVPVTTIVGYYDPSPKRTMVSYIYPALHGAYGFVYNDDGGSSTGTPTGCELVVKVKKTKSNIAGILVHQLDTSVDSEGMNKFHVNVATADKPKRASIYCNNEKLADRRLEGPKGPLTYTVNGAPFADQCVDKNLEMGKKKRGCEYVGNGKKRSTVKKRCRIVYRKQKVYDWCPATCGEVGLGKCA